MSNPLPEDLDLDTATPGVYRYYAEGRQPFDQPTHVIEAFGPAPVRTWRITERETGTVTIVHRREDGTVTSSPA